MNQKKQPEVRKGEILDAAERLFAEKSYDRTTINDMLEAVGISKGAFYHYFKSKEDVLDAVIERWGETRAQTAKCIAVQSDLSATKKLLRIMLEEKPRDAAQSTLINELEKLPDGPMFMKTLTYIVLRLSPIWEEVVMQGIAEGVFNTPFPLESAEILLALAHSLFDNASLRRAPEDESRRTIAFLLSAERILGAREGSLTELAALFRRDAQ
jgi:AcrR family transcriptional regulator